MQAADAFFCDGDVDRPSATGPRWGPKAGAAGASAAPQAQSEPPAQAQEPSPPPPMQPPPPCLPAGWKAVWNEEQNSFYYWHVPTNKVQWDLPAGADERTLQEA